MAHTQQKSLKNNLKFQIPNSKAVVPQAIVYFIIAQVIGAFHFDIFGWVGYGISVSILLAFGIWYYLSKKGEYFIEVDAEGIRWRAGILSPYKNLPWKFVQRIDYLVYEINFMLKETAQVVSFGTSSLRDSETEELKQAISEIVGNRQNGLSD